MRKDEKLGETEDEGFWEVKTTGCRLRLRSRSLEHEPGNEMGLADDLEYKRNGMPLSEKEKKNEAGKLLFYPGIPWRYGRESKVF